MFMGWFKVQASDLQDSLKILDALAPNWSFANDDHIARRASLIMTHTDLLAKGYDTEVELWVIIPSELEAFNVKAVLPFEEFGYAVWDNDRKVRNSYHATGSGNTPIPGYVIVE